VPRRRTGRREWCGGRRSPEGGRTLDQYREAGVQYLVTNAGVSGAYITQPHRYPSEAAFYLQLHQQSSLRHEFRPNAHRYGPIIRVYELMPLGAGCGARPRP
jgi:hypothetical protein